MVKVKFIKDWGICKKGEVRDVSKVMLRDLIELKVIKITKEVNSVFPDFKLLKQVGLNPYSYVYTRNMVIDALIKAKESK